MDTTCFSLGNMPGTLDNDINLNSVCPPSPVNPLSEVQQCLVSVSDHSQKLNTQLSVVDTPEVLGSDIFSSQVEDEDTTHIVMGDMPETLVRNT